MKYTHEFTTYATSGGRHMHELGKVSVLVDYHVARRWWEWRVRSCDLRGERAASSADAHAAAAAGLREWAAEILALADALEVAP